LKRLHKFATTVEHTLQPEADFDAVIAHEHRISPALGGRSVFGPELPAKADCIRAEVEPGTQRLSPTACHKSAV
jgi:hypothetical protein